MMRAQRHPQLSPGSLFAKRPPTQKDKERYHRKSVTYREHEA